MNSKTYPRTNDRQTVYLNTVIGNPMIEGRTLPPTATAGTTRSTTIS